MGHTNTPADNSTQRPPVHSDAAKGYVIHVEQSSGQRQSLAAIAKSRIAALSIAASAFDHDFTSLKEVKRYSRPTPLKLVEGSPCV